MTIAEIEADLLNVNTAISKLVAGKRLTELRIGTGDSQQVYRYQEITLDMLYQLRDKLRTELNSLQPSTPVFRKNSYLPIVVGKGYD